MTPMNVTCDDCRSVFRIDPAKNPATGVRARCSVCGSIIRIMPALAPVTRSATPALGAVASAFEASSAGGVATAPPRMATPASGMRATPPLGARSATPAPYVPVAVRTPTPRAASPATPAVPTPVRATPALPPLPAAPTPRAVPPISTPTPMPASVASTTPVAQTTVRPTPVTTPAPTVTESPTPPVSRRLNPFMTVDPNQRARRLARALVSDIVAYHPQKRDDGLRNGTLKQLFRDEIKKSYEEYVEQVGRELAESTSHFQDALNDVLANGRRLF